MHRIRFLVPFALAAAVSLPAGATTYFVNNAAGSGCNDLGPGTQPVPFCTIQKGYDTAGNNDEIRVAPGTYGECLFLGFSPLRKNVAIVASAWLGNPPNNTVTIIDGALAGPCTFPNTAPASLVNLSGSGATGSSFKGFTVRGATDSGIFGVGSVAITNNVVTNNDSPSYGGGIYIYTANCYYGNTVATISDNQVTNNTAGVGGGGIQVTSGRQDIVQAPECTEDGDATVTVQNNTVTGNTGVGGGGGVHATIFNNSIGTSSVVITQNTITGNSAGAALTYGYGGGIYGLTYGYGDERIEVVDNTVANNTSTDLGGGISASCSPFVATANSTDHLFLIENNRVTGNTGERGGGGLDLYILADSLASPEAVRMQAIDNLVTGNLVTFDIDPDTQQLPPNFNGGGGISAQLFSLTSTSTDVGLTIEENRVSNNSSKVYGGGATLRAVSDGDLTDLGGGIAPARAKVEFRGNRVTQNTATSTETDAVGGGVLAYMEAEGDAISTIEASLNTIAGNTLDNMVEPGGIQAESFTISDSLGQNDGLAVLRVTNSIIANNDGVGLGGPTPGTAGAVTPGGNAEFDTSALNYNDFFGNDINLDGWLTAGTGNLFSDPLLDATTFVPTKCSPTIDAADPALDFSLEPLPNGGRANMGHTGATAQATRSLADVSGDGIVDGIDVLRLSVAFGSMTGEPRFNSNLDFTDSLATGPPDGLIDGGDLSVMAPDFGQCAP